MKRPRPAPSKSHLTGHVPEFAERHVSGRTLGARMVVAEGVPSGSDRHRAACLRPLLTQGEAA